MYLDTEEKARVWFSTSEDGYIYLLSDLYDDDSGDALYMSTDWDTIWSVIKKDSDNNSLEKDYIIRRYTYTCQDGMINVDFDDYCGSMYLNKDMEIKYFESVAMYQTNFMDTLPLLNPYMILPIPFKRGDFIQLVFSDGETQIGIADIVELKEDPLDTKHPHDGSDVCILLQLPIDEGNGDIRWDYDHVYPYDLDYAKLSEDDPEYEFYMRAREEMFRKFPEH